MRRAQLAGAVAAQWLPVSAHALARCRPERCNVFRRSVLDARGPLFLACPMAIVRLAAPKGFMRSKSGSRAPRPSPVATVVAIALRDGGVRVEARAASAAAQGQRNAGHGGPEAVPRADERPKAGSTPRTASGGSLRVLAVSDQHPRGQQLPVGRPASQRSAKARC